MGKNSNIICHQHFKWISGRNEGDFIKVFLSNLHWDNNWEWRTHREKSRRGDEYVKMVVDLHRSVPLRQNCHVLTRELTENDVTTIRRAFQGRPPTRTCCQVTEIKMKILARENKFEFFSY